MARKLVSAICAVALVTLLVPVQATYATETTELANTASGEEAAKAFDYYYVDATDGVGWALGVNTADSTMPAAKTYTVTANLCMPGEYNPVLSGVSVYVNNPNNPFTDKAGNKPVLDGGSAEGVEDVAPTTPMSNNATITVAADGTRTLTLDLPNPVFTLQELGTCDQLSDVKVETKEPADSSVWDYGSCSTRISRITATIPADATGRVTYTFYGSKLYAVPINTWIAPDATSPALQLTVDLSSLASESQTVYRMYNPITGEHLFTTDESEYESLVTENWQKEGEAWSSPTSGKGVYRLYNAALGAVAKMSHHYTTDEAEVKLLTDKYGWVADNDGKPIFYSAEDESGNALEGASPVYRLYNGGLSAHHYTLDKDENDKLTTNHGWSGEGVGFYAVKTNSGGVE